MGTWSELLHGNKVKQDLVFVDDNEADAHKLPRIVLIGELVLPIANHVAEGGDSTKGATRYL